MHLVQVTAVDPDPEAFPIVYSVDSVVFHKHSSTVEQVKMGQKWRHLKAIFPVFFKMEISEIFSYKVNITWDSPTSSIFDKKEPWG